MVDWMLAACPPGLDSVVFFAATCAQPRQHSHVNVGSAKGLLPNVSAIAPHPVLAIEHSEDA
eukprot:13495239-Alexandrium_andersonii.AAC.1